MASRLQGTVAFTIRYRPGARLIQQRMTTPATFGTVMLSDPFTAFLSSASCREPFDDLQRFYVHEGRPAGAGVDHSDGLARARRYGVAGRSHARPGHRDQAGLRSALR
ncbi:hypothetical protein XHV734_0898 [Xanthomonas hortorum pv. vitians]|nr:hypothetical protein XHV734_0898 [Xanthomonas hortorum pv. vitians]